MAQQPDGKLDERTFVRRVLIVIGLVMLAYLAWQLRTILLMFFGAVVVAAIFRALADLIEHHTRAPRWLATAVSILSILGGFFLLILLFGAQIGSQVQTLRETLPVAWKAFEARIGDLGLGNQVKNLMASIQAPGGGSLSSFGRAIISVGGGIADTIIVIVAGIFLAAQPRFYWTGAIKLVPEERRAIVAKAMDESGTVLRLWLRGQLISMVVVGLLTGIGLWLLGMPSALALGLLAGVLEFIPFAGPLLAAVPAILLALAVSPELALWVLLLYVAVQQFEGAILTPLVQQYAVEIPGVVLLFALLAFGALFGSLGVILAAPLGVVSYVLVKRFYVIETLSTPTPIPGTKEAKRAPKG